MKTCIAILLCFFCNESYTQVIAFGADKMNVLYIGVDNPITVVAENTDCSKIKLTAKNLTLSGSDCKYVARVENIGNASITVTYMLNGKIKNTVGEFRVKHLPLPIFKVGTGQKRLPLFALKAQEFVRADLENCDIDLNFSIDSFSVSIFSKETSTNKKVKNVGNKISNDTKELFYSLNPGEEILFTDIYSHKLDGEVFMLEPILMAVY